MRSFIRSDEVGRSLVLVDSQTVLPLRVAMRGVCFRIPLSREETKRGVLVIRPAFDYFLHRELDPAAVQLRDRKGRPLPVRVVGVQKKVEGLFGKEEVEYTAFDLGNWFRAGRVRRDDSVLVTIEDWEAGRFRLEHEPAGQYRQEEIERKDQELADALFAMLESARYERLYPYVALPTALARLADSRGYPGSHWLNVVARDPRMTYDGFAIHYAEFRSPLSRMLGGREEVAHEEPFTSAEGRQVYRFKAVLWNRPGLWRTIEIEGRQTLVEFNSILRDAFGHDHFDHMGGFWKRVRRGKSKRFREIDVGDIDPFGGGSGSGQHVAGLGLQPGDELKYVYDFGDWIQHRVTLLEIVEPEAKAEYPRIVAQNEPRYRNCESCRARGHEERATWICVECSDEQQRGVLLCETCLCREHEDHYAEEILY
jgi:hypothetical protein